MGWWVAGAALAVLTMWAVRDAGRNSQASRAALGLMRAVGGFGLLVIGAQAVQVGAGALALIALGPALALFAGIFKGIRAPTATTTTRRTDDNNRTERTEATTATHPPATTPPAAEHQRAA